MTREHVPPKSAVNADEFRRLEDPFDPKSAAAEIEKWSDGHTVSTLCEPCNARASRWKYVAEYRRWFDHFVAEGRKIAKQKGIDPFLAPEPFEIELPYDVMPARFIRQVVGMFLAIQEDHVLVASYPQLAALIGPGAAETSQRRKEGLDIDPIRIEMAVDNASFAFLRMAGAVRMTPSSSGLLTPPGARSSRDMFAMMRCTPFVFFVTDGDEQPGLDIAQWAQWHVDRRPTKHERRLTVPTVTGLPGLAAGMLRHPRER